MQLYIIFGIIIILLCLFLYKKINKSKETFNIEEKYNIYHKLFDKYIYVKELIIEGDNFYFIKNKLKPEQIDIMVYYLIIPNNNLNNIIKNIIINYLDFIEPPDLIKNDNNMSNYYGLLDALHELTGKDGTYISSLTKKEFLDLLKN
jgi:hypothetical protein